MAKMLFDLQRGVIEVEGQEEFVEKVYADLRTTLTDKVATYRVSAAEPETTSATPPASEEEAKKTRKRTKSSGPSCASRIEALKAEKFFEQLRTPKEIGNKLREKGTDYQGNRIAAALISMTTAGKLRRIQEEGGWKYQNP